MELQATKELSVEQMPESTLGNGSLRTPTQNYIFYLLIFMFLIVTNVYYLCDCVLRLTLVAVVRLFIQIGLSLLVTVALPRIQVTFVFITSYVFNLYTNSATQ